MVKSIDVKNLSTELLKYIDIVKQLLQYRK